MFSRIQPGMGEQVICLSYVLFIFEFIKLNSNMLEYQLQIYNGINKKICKHSKVYIINELLNIFVYKPIYR